MPHFVIARFAKQLGLSFLLYNALIAGWGANRHANLEHGLLGSNVPFLNGLALKSLIGHIYSIEFLPVYVFLVFYMFSSYLQGAKFLFFWKLLGLNYKRQLLGFFALLTLGLSLLFSVYAVSLLPRFLDGLIGKLPAILSKELLYNTAHYLKPDQLNKLGNFYLSYKDAKGETGQAKGSLEKSRLAKSKLSRNDAKKNSMKGIAQNKAFYLNDLTLFATAPLYQSGIPMQDTTVIHSIIKCDAVFRQKTRFERIVLERCVKGDVSGHFGQPDLESAPIKIRGMLVTDIITKFKKKYRKVDIKSNLPYSLEKYTRSFSQLREESIKNPCPATSFRLYDKVFYLLSFFLYGCLGFLIPLYLPAKASSLLRFLIAFFYAGIIPFIGIYVKMLNPSAYDIFESNHFLLCFMGASSILLYFLFYLTRRITPYVIKSFKSQQRV